MSVLYLFTCSSVPADTLTHTSFSTELKTRSLVNISIFIEKDLPKITASLWNKYLNNFQCFYSNYYEKKDTFCWTIFPLRTVWIMAVYYKSSFYKVFICLWKYSSMDFKRGGKIKKLKPRYLKYGNVQINEVTEVKLLGVKIQNNFSLMAEIENHYVLRKIKTEMGRLHFQNSWWWIHYKNSLKNRTAAGLLFARF